MQIRILTFTVAGAMATVNATVERLLCGSQLAEFDGGCGVGRDRSQLSDAAVRLQFLSRGRRSAWANDRNRRLGLARRLSAKVNFQGGPVIQVILPRSPPKATVGFSSSCHFQLFIVALTTISSCHPAHGARVTRTCLRLSPLHVVTD